MAIVDLRLGAIGYTAQAMKILKIIGIVCLLLVMLFFVVGQMLPSEWQTSYSAEVHATPDRIYSEIANLKNWQHWSPWNNGELGMTSTYSGPEEGVGAQWDWASKKMGNGYLKIIQADPKSGIMYDLFIDMNGHQSRFVGQMAFQVTATGTQVTWTDQGNAKGEIVRKWMGLLMGIMVKRNMEQGLAQLDALLK